MAVSDVECVKVVSLRFVCEDYGFCMNGVSVLGVYDSKSAEGIGT